MYKRQVYVETVNLNTDAVYSDRYEKFFLSFEGVNDCPHTLMLDMKNKQHYVFENFDTTAMPYVGDCPFYEARQPELTRTELVKNALNNPSSLKGSPNMKDGAVERTPVLLGDKDCLLYTSRCV